MHKFVFDINRIIRKLISFFEMPDSVTKEIKKRKSVKNQQTKVKLQKMLCKKLSTTEPVERVHLKNVTKETA